MSERGSPLTHNDAKIDERESIEEYLPLANESRSIAVEDRNRLLGERFDASPSLFTSDSSETSGRLIFTDRRQCTGRRDSSNWHYRSATRGVLIEENRISDLT